MLKRFMYKLTEKIISLGMLFGLLYVMLIASDSGKMFMSARYYFWIVAPLVVFSLILMVLETLFERSSRSTR